MTLMLFLQNEAKKYLFMNGLQFASPAESQTLRVRSDKSHQSSNHFALCSN